MTGVVIGSLVADTGRMSDARTYAVTEQPEHGFVSVWPTGGFIYTPDPRARLDAHRSGAVLMDGFRAVVGEVDGTVTELHVHGVPVHPARAAVIATVPVGDRPSVPVLAPDDSRVYVTHVDEPVVTVIDATTYTAMESVVVPARASGVSFSRDGGYVFAARVGGRHRRRVARGCRPAHRATFGRGAYAGSRPGNGGDHPRCDQPRPERPREGHRGERTGYVRLRRQHGLRLGVGGEDRRPVQPRVRS